MEVSESNPAVEGQLIDIRSANLASEAAQVGEAKVISDNEEEIGSFFNHCDWESMYDYSLLLKFDGMN